MVRIQGVNSHACQPCKGIFEICIVFSDFFARASNCSGSNLGRYWGLKMKSRGLYHAYRLWKSGLLLDFQQVGPPYYLLHMYMFVYSILIDKNLDISVLSSRYSKGDLYSISRLLLWIFSGVASTSKMKKKSISSSLYTILIHS